MFSARYNRLIPYVAGEQPQDRNYIKLNTNENPYPPCPEVAEIIKNFRPERLRLYPDPECTRLREAVADAEGLDPQNVFMGNGSDEVLSFSFYAFFDGASGPLLFPRYTYSFYPVYCRYYSIPYETFDLKEDFSLPLEGLLDRYPRFAGIIFPNPNAPTGIYEPLDQIESLLSAAEGKAIVVVDEAYIEFGGESAVSLLKKFNHLAVVKTFSKSHGLAGIRLGYLLASREIVQALERVKDSFNSYPVDTLTQEIGRAALGNPEYYGDMNGRIIRTRDLFSRGLSRLGWQVLPSKANFVFARHPGRTGEEIYTAFRDSGFLVRHFSTPGIEDFVRITIGTEDHMESLLSLCENIFRGEVII